MVQRANLDAQQLLAPRRTAVPEEVRLVHDRDDDRDQRCEEHVLHEVSGEVERGGVLAGLAGIHGSVELVAELLSCLEPEVRRQRQGKQEHDDPVEGPGPGAPPPAGQRGAIWRRGTERRLPGLTGWPVGPIGRVRMGLPVFPSIGLRPGAALRASIRLLRLPILRRLAVLGLLAILRLLAVLGLLAVLRRLARSRLLPIRLLLSVARLLSESLGLG